MASSASRIPLNSLLPFARLKLEEQLARWRDNAVRVQSIGLSAYAHLLMLGGFAGIAWGFWLLWHPLGPITGGWFALRLATMMAEEMERKGR